MDRQNILLNLKITCKQNDIKVEDVIVQFIADNMIGGYDNDIGGSDCDVEYLLNKELNEGNFNEIKEMLNEEQDLLWDLQPTIEDDEEHAFAVQHASDIYNILLGEF